MFFDVDDEWQVPRRRWIGAQLHHRPAQRLYPDGRYAAGARDFVGPSACCVDQDLRKDWPRSCFNPPTCTLAPCRQQFARVGDFRSCLRSEEHTSELQSLMRISYAVFCLKKKINNTPT